MAIPIADETILTNALIAAVNIRRTIVQLPTAPPAILVLRTDTLTDLNTIIVRMNTYLNTNL